MATDPLQRTSEILHEASNAADDEETSAELADHAELVHSYVTDDREPGTERLERHQHELSALASREGGVVANRINDALTQLRAHREMHGEQ